MLGVQYCYRTELSAHADTSGKQERKGRGHREPMLALEWRRERETWWCTPSSLGHCLRGLPHILSGVKDTVESLVKVGQGLVEDVDSAQESVGREGDKRGVMGDGGEKLTIGVAVRFNDTAGGLEFGESTLIGGRSGRCWRGSGTSVGN